jgi:hypothetical protein
MPRVDKRTMLVIAVVAGLIAYVVVRHGDQSPVPSPLRAAAGAQEWIVGQDSIRLMIEAGASHQLIQRAFDNDHTFVYGNNNDKPSSIGVPTAAFTSYAAIVQAFSRAVLPGKYKAVLYDNERWPYTPAVEQRDPAHYEALVSHLLHQHGLIYIATPSPDLTLVFHRHADTFSNYLREGMAATAARYADVLDLQAQFRENQLAVYRAFVQTAIAQARAANPRVVVLVGIRTNPGPAAMYAAYEATVSLGGAGYWLNVNGRPLPAVDLLRRIYHMN